MSYSIDDMFSMVVDLIRDLEMKALVYTDEGNDGIVIGKRRDYPQTVGVEFLELDEVEGIDTKEVELRFQRLTNQNSWNLDDDGFFSNDGCEVFVHRDLDPDEVSPFRDQTEKSQTVNGRN